MSKLSLGVQKAATAVAAPRSATGYQLLPNLTIDEYEALTESIRALGVLVPVEVDDEGNILDGHHRAAIASELGIDYPTVVRAGLTEEQKVQQVLALNLDRRHLSREQRAELVGTLRRQRMSTRKIAGLLRTSDDTVRRDLQSIAANAAIPEPLPETVDTADGRSYPARRPDPFEMTDVHRQKFPELAYGELRSALIGEVHRFARPTTFVPEEWAERVPLLRAEDVAYVRQQLGWVRRRLEAWDRLLDRPALSIVEGRAE